jgi:putative DNA primase/helicase
MTAQLLEQLHQLPDDWAFVAVGLNKRAYHKDWADRPLSKAAMAEEITAGRAHAIGVQAGPASGGILFLDHDGQSATDQLKRLGIPLDSLPKSWAMTSGRDGRFQVIYRVPEQFWPALRNRRWWHTGEPDPETGKPTKVVGPDDKAEQIDLRWARHYSVVAGAHPDTTGYRWLRGRGPTEQALAEAPTALIELLLQEPDPDPDPTPLLTPQALPPPPETATLPLLDFISRDSRDLVDSGGTPGAWNDDQLRLALDLRGTEAWIRAQGHTPDISASQAFALHIQAARAKARDFDEKKAWRRFDGAEGRSSNPSTPEDKLLARLRFHTRPPKTRQKPQAANHPEPPDGSPDPPPIRPSAGGYFTCLGFDLDAFYYQPHRTGQVVRLSRSSHTGTNLVALAPLGYWEALYPGKSGPNWTAAASDLFEQQAAVGIYSPERIRGRGAWWDGGRSVLHLGDRLFVNGEDRSITDRLKDSTYLYQRLSSLQGPGDAQPLLDTEAFQLAEIAQRFHWEVPASGLLLAGWVTLAPICGAISWRPHVWLTAAAGSGKSAILDRYVTPLLGDMGLIVAGNTTEPGIRQALRADALPVVFDEAESNERTDQQRMQAILGLARVASSESKAHTLKGTPEGDTQRFTIRSMFLMSSIATSLKQGADRSRFAQLTLRNPSELPKEARLAHWEALDRDLDRFISEEIGRRLQARTLSLIPVIRASIRVFTRVAAERFDSQRLGDQYGTLLAGAWSLHSSEVVTTEQAQQLIDQNNWEPYSQATEVPDERRCIQRILQHQVRVEGEKTVTRSIGELVELALHREHDFHIEASLAQSTLGRNGIKAEEGSVVISNNAEAIAAILRDTAWSNCWPTVLTRLPGATKAGSIYFKGAGATSRAVRIPLDAIDRAEQP